MLLCHSFKAIFNFNPFLMDVKCCHLTQTTRYIFDAVNHLCKFIPCLIKNNRSSSLFNSINSFARISRCKEAMLIGKRIVENILIKI